MRVGAGRVEVLDLAAHRERQAQPARGVDPAAVAIDRELHQRVIEAAPLVVEQDHRVLEGVPHRVVQWLVGIADIDPGLDQTGGEVLAGLAMAAHPHRLVLRLAPRVPGASAMRPGLQFLVVIGEDRKGRDDVLLEVLVLVVAPHHDDIGVEFVDDAARLGEMRAINLAAPRRRGGAPVVPQFLAQLRRPVRRVLHLLGHRRVVERGAQHERPVFIGAQHQRAMRAAHSEDLAHRRPPIRVLFHHGDTEDTETIQNRHPGAGRDPFFNRSSGRRHGSRPAPG